MQGKFEKNIEQRLYEYSLEPSPQIWQNVEKLIPSRHKDRGMFWWWGPLLGVFLLGGGWWLYHIEMQSVNKSQPLIIQNKKADESQLIIKKDKESEKNTTLINQEKIANKKLLPTQNENVNPEVALSGKVSRIHKLNEPQVNNVIEQAVVQQKEPAATTINSTKEKRQVEMPQDMDRDKLPTVIKTNIDSIIELKSSTRIKKSDDASIIKSTSENTSLKKEGKNKLQRFISFGAGTLNINKPGFLSAGQINVPNSALNVGTGFSTNNTSLPKPQNGFNLLAGINYEYSLNKRWSFYSGLQYRYLQNKQSVGSDSVASGGNIYFAAGNTAILTNNAHLVQIPFGMNYIINPASKNRFQLILGGSFAWVLTEKWLVTDLVNSNHPFYYHTELNNHALINIQGGIGYNINDHFRISLMADQSITPIHHQVSVKYYQQQWSIQLSKPLQQASKKNKTSKP